MFQDIRVIEETSYHRCGSSSLPWPCEILAVGQEGGQAEVEVNLFGVPPVYVCVCTLLIVFSPAEHLQENVTSQLASASPA